LEYTKIEIKTGKVINMTAIDLTSNNFKEVALNSEKTVLIDFWAPWCGPCKMQSPIIEELADELKDSVVITKLNVDDNPELAAQFSVMSIPTLIFIKDGKVVNRKTGLTPKVALVSIINSVNSLTPSGISL
jgi:thioredoxin 1